MDERLFEGIDDRSDRHVAGGEAEAPVEKQNDTREAL